MAVGCANAKVAVRLIPSEVENVCCYYHSVQAYFSLYHIKIIPSNKPLLSHFKKASSSLRKSVNPLFCAFVFWNNSINGMFSAWKFAF